MGIAVVSKGSGGFGTPLEISVEGERNKIVSMTGTGIHPVAQKIADITGGVAVDGAPLTGHGRHELIVLVVFGMSGIKIF